MQFEVVPYSPELSSVWNTAIEESRNGTFLHHRDFMDYHADRFVDASVLVRDESDNILAVFPANRVLQRVTSHGGLTYGGLIYSPRLKQSACVGLMGQLLEYYRALGIKEIIYKAIPHVFHRSPGHEDLYALTRHGANLIRRDVSTVVDLLSNYRFSKGRVWSVNKGRKAGIVVIQQDDPEVFHALLTVVLAQYDVSPVHTVDELRLLMKCFPQNIQLFAAVLGGDILAGTLVFDFGHIVHTQYLASSSLGRELGALDYLIAELMKVYFSKRHYFSFGISTEQSGQFLNEGLVAQKEGFGGASVCHDFYQLVL